MSTLTAGYGATTNGNAFTVAEGLDRFEALDLANALTAAGHEILQCAATGHAPAPDGMGANGALFLLEAARALIGAVAKEIDQ